MFRGVDRVTSVKFWYCQSSVRWNQDLGQRLFLKDKKILIYVIVIYGPSTDPCGIRSKFNNSFLVTVIFKNRAVTFASFGRNILSDK